MARDTVFRFYNEDTGVHFYTASPDEVNSILANLSSFRFESVAYTIDGTCTDVHRYLNTQTGTHFFTQSAAEKASIDANLPHLQYEGVAYQANDRGDHLNGTSDDDVLDLSATRDERDLFGLDGNDTLAIRYADVVHVGNGDDVITLTGEGVFDLRGTAAMHGGAGADTFTFKALLTSGFVGGIYKDTDILDFNFSEGDRIVIDDPLDERLGFSAGVSFANGGTATNVLENVLRIHVTEGETGAEVDLQMLQGIIGFRGNITLIGVSASEVTSNAFSIS